MRGFLPRCNICLLCGIDFLFSWLSHGLYMSTQTGRIPMNKIRAKEILILISLSFIAFYTSFYIMLIDLSNLTSYFIPKLTNYFFPQVVLIYFPRSFIFILTSLLYGLIIKRDYYYALIMPLLSILYESIFALIYKINYLNFGRYVLLSQLIMILFSFLFSYLGVLIGYRMIKWKLVISQHK